MGRLKKGLALKKKKEHAEKISFFPKEGNAIQANPVADRETLAIGSLINLI